MDEQALNGIYIEAMWFVAVFVSMYTISFVMSWKQAKRYEEENPLENRREKIMALKKHKVAMALRASELLELHKEKVITFKELQVLQNNLDNIIE